MIKNGVVFDPIEIEEGSDPLVADGNHRLRAYLYLQHPQIPARVTGSDSFVDLFLENP